VSPTATQPAVERTLPFAAEAILARASRENFPVALRLLGRDVRAHLLAIYGFARLVDELGDSAPGDRSALLDRLEEDLDRAFAGKPEHPLLQALAPTVRSLDLPRAPFARLIEANRRDQVQERYATLADLVDYCRLSANPVGELVLHVYGAATPERIAYSDAVCTALQLVEHWQDVGEDFRSGRIYLPEEDLRRFGVREADLASAATSVPLRRLLAFEVGRAQSLLDEGAPLVGSLQGRPRVAVAGYVGGGRAAIAALRHADFEVLAATPRASAALRLRAIGATLWRGR
jgi:squalene synthase HpnC